MQCMHTRHKAARNFAFAIKQPCVHSNAARSFDIFGEVIHEGALAWEQAQRIGNGQIGAWIRFVETDRHAGQ